LIKIYYSTIDIDLSPWLLLRFSSLGDLLSIVIGKIERCPDLLHYVWSYSPSTNGYHIQLYCRKECSMCRLVFDDQRRAEADFTNRQPHQRNVLFDEKEIRYRGKVVVRWRKG